jgi:hypothetical protein
MPFAAGNAADSRLLDVPGDGSIEVPVVDILRDTHDVDVMKMDIEGGEWAILGDARFAALGARRLVMEWHTHLCPDADPHAAVRRLLESAGYRIALDHPSGSLRNGLIWAQR